MKTTWETSEADTLLRLTKQRAIYAQAAKKVGYTITREQYGGEYFLSVGPKGSNDERCLCSTMDEVECYLKGVYSSLGHSWLGD